MEGNIYRTLCSKILLARNLVHLLQRLGLFSSKRLLVIIFTGPPYPVEYYPAAGGVSEEVDESENQGYECGRAERR